MSAELEIFKAGSVRDSNGRAHSFTRGDIEAIAAAYDPAVHEAPLVIGHPADNKPAYGWTRALSARGDTLVAHAHQVDAEFSSLVNRAYFKKKSASFYTPNAPDNPKPGTWYLRHVGFLGAAAPAVKGLRDASFAEKGIAERRLATPQDVACEARRLMHAGLASNAVEAVNMLVGTQTQSRDLLAFGSAIGGFVLFESI